VVINFDCFHLMGKSFWVPADFLGGFVRFRADLSAKSLNIVVVIAIVKGL